MPNRAVQIDYLFGPARKLDGSTISGGAVIAYIADARDASGSRVYRRAQLWKDQDRRNAHANGRIDFNSAGLPIDPDDTLLTAPVYGDGSYLLHFYYDEADAPTGAETENPLAYSDPADPNYPNPDRKEVFHVSHDVVNVRHFGAVGDGNPDKPGSGTDDTLAIQNAIDYCIRPGELGENRQRILYFPAGTYRITKTLLILNTYFQTIPKPGGQAGETIDAEKFTYCSIQIHGEKNRSDDSVDVVIYAELLDGPAIAMQAGRGVVIRQIGITGTNRFDETFNDAVAVAQGDYTKAYGATLHDTFYYYDWNSFDWQGKPPLLVGKCRDNRQSPHAAIVIDPFAAEARISARAGDSPPGGVPWGCQYPNLTKWYRLYDYVFSTAVLIEGCAFARFVVGVMVGPTGNAANAENIIIRQTHFETVRIAMATAVTQSRGFNIDTCDVNLCQFVVDNRTYGAGENGAPPNIRGLTASVIKYFFNLNVAGTSLALEQIYAEGILSLGYLGADFNELQNTVVLSGCEFIFHVSHPMVNIHLYSYANVGFVGCAFHMADNPGSRSFPPIRFANRAPLRFVSCAMRAGPGEPDPALASGADLRWLHGQPAWGFEEPTLCSFEDVSYLDNYTANDTGSILQPPNNARVTFLRQRYNGVEGSVDDQKDLGVGTGLIRQHLPPGSAIAPTGTGDSRDTILLRHVSSHLNRIPLSTDVVPLRIYLSDVDTIYFGGFAGQLLPGDVVYLLTATNNAGWQLPLYPAPSQNDSVGTIAIDPQPVFPTIAPIGCVTRIVGGKNYIDCAPNAIVDRILASGLIDPLGNHEHFDYFYAAIQRFGRYHGATTGSWTSVPTQNISVSVAAGLTVRAVWKKGDRIATDLLTGGGVSYIPAGTYVEQVTQNGGNPTLGVLTVSKVLQTATPIGISARLYDADVFRVALTPE